MVEEPRGQSMKTQVLWPLQQAQHMAGKVGWVVLVATMALVTQLALVTWSIEEFPGGSGELTDPRGPRASGESGGAAAAILQIPGAPNASGPGGDPVRRAGVLSNRVFQLYPIPGAPVGQAAVGVGVWARGGLEDCRLQSLKCRRRVLWEAGGYGSRVVWLSVHGGEEKHCEVIQRVGR